MLEIYPGFLNRQKQAKNEVATRSFGFRFRLGLCGLRPAFPALRAQIFDTNDLWLEIALANNAAAFTIHAPATNANGVFDLFFKTNLTDNQDWTWLFRCSPGQTNLVMSNLPPDQGFFMLGVTNAIRPGFDQFSLPREDDSPSSDATFPFTMNFFAALYSNAWVNNNGNVTFDNPQSAYTPSSLNTLGIRIIAPFWADVDTDNTNSDVVKYGTNVVDGHAAFGVDWVNVGYYQAHADKLLSSQLVIIDRSDIDTGDFDMEFNYYKVQWEWGMFQRTVLRTRVSRTGVMITNCRVPAWKGCFWIQTR